MEENGEQQNPTATTAPNRPTESNDTPPPVTTTQTRPVASTVPTFGATSRDKYTMTTGEVRAIFYRDGLFRAPRSIERYCKEEKLDCFLDPDEKRYYVRPESVGTLISHIKAQQARRRYLRTFCENVILYQGLNATNRDQRRQCQQRNVKRAPF